VKRQNRIEDQSDGNVSGGERWPKTGRGKPETPAARKKYNPAGENVETVRMLGGGIKRHPGGKAAEDNKGDANARCHQ